MISQPELEAAVHKTILLYNRLKSPGAVAKVVRILPGIVTIAYSGSFCNSCGDVTHLAEDFSRDFKVFTTKAELAAGKTRETSPRTFETDYYVRDKSK